VSFRLERLGDGHPVTAFSCGARAGAAEIDRFLHADAWTEQCLGLSTTTIAVDPATTEIVGFYTLSPHTVRIDPSVLKALGMPDVQDKQVGGYLLGRLGVSAAHQGRGYGELLVERAIDAARTARQTTAGVYLAVDPKNDRLLNWYLSLGFGFARLDPRHRRIALKL
jgi:ribosomal protein S18 acetylase RimI-like enzyme